VDELAAVQVEHIGVAEVEHGVEERSGLEEEVVDRIHAEVAEDIHHDVLVEEEEGGKVQELWAWVAAVVVQEVQIWDQVGFLREGWGSRGTD